MATLNEGNHPGEFIISEGNGNISRESITVVTGQNLTAGTVVGIITASGKYKNYDNVAVDGSEVAAGILYADVDATAADVEGVMIARLAEVDSGSLNGSDASGVIDLEALYIIQR
jgi:hypothetical protein